MKDYLGILLLPVILLTVSIFINQDKEIVNYTDYYTKTYYDYLEIC